MAKFKPGQSGNPSGRPPDPFRALIHEKTHNGKDLVTKALELLDSDDEDIQVKAVNWLADRGWGKATQMLELPEGASSRMVLIFPA